MMTWLVWVWHGVAGCALFLGSDFETCMTGNSARSVAQGAETSPAYCTPCRWSRQQVCRNSLSMINQNRCHEVSEDRSYSGPARNIRRQQERWQ
jgi:hypothetical protein